MQHKELLKPNAGWIQTLWNAMGVTGKGYRKMSMKRTGKGTDRRDDKLKGPLANKSKSARSYFYRYCVN